GNLTLEDGFIASLNWKNKLLPTITQDENGQVLMMAYSNKDSVRKTFETGKMWYFSRSRNALWMKGETSTNTQEFMRARMDCDADTILATVKQHGVACHTGSYSCFGEQKFCLNELYDVLLDRIQNPKAGSYTATLTNELLNEKLAEESQELIEAKTRDEIIWETADVLYFLTVLLARNNIKPGDVLFELRRRRKK
ncbi:MAG: phosphoribosyl-ATP diphosphatase, partial [Candidatus Fischerbacteria bacterium RBG_13_37_8]